MFFPRHVGWPACCTLGTRPFTACVAVREDRLVFFIAPAVGHAFGAFKSDSGNDWRLLCGDP
jgi:hypothetical protein